MREAIKDPRLRYLWAFLAGSILWMPSITSIRWLVCIASIAIFKKLLTSRASESKAIVAMFAFGWFFVGLFWMNEVHTVGFVINVVVQTAVFTGLFLLFNKLIPHGVFFLPLLLASHELLRFYFPFSGFPLASISLIQASASNEITPPYAALSMIAGPVGLTFVVSLIAVLYTAISWRKCLVITVITGAVAMSMASIKVETNKFTTIALVQGGGPRGTRALTTDSNLVFQRHVDQTKTLLRTRSKIDLVVWPEGVIDVDDSFESTRQSRTIGRLARSLGTPITAGVVEPLNNMFENSVYVWDANGNLVDKNIKRHRVPFGEYIPFRSTLDNYVDLSLVPDDATIGHGSPTIRLCPTPCRRNVGVLISYEVFFPDLARQASQHTNYIVVPTNATTYKGSQVAEMELAASRLRAIETGKFVGQAAPTGLTAMVAPDGAVTAIGPYSAGINIIQSVDPSAKQAVPLHLYQSIGDLGVLILLLLSMATLYVSHTVAQKRDKLDK